MLEQAKLGDKLPLDSNERIEWLQRQPDDKPAQELSSPQPWMQLATVLEANGNPSGAKKVTFEFQRQQVHNSNWALRCATFCYDIIDEQPFWILLPIGLLWLFGFVIFWRASRMNAKAMAPRENDAFKDFADSRPLPGQYAPFNPAMYALENVLPVVKLGQDDAWGPNPQSKPASWFPKSPRLAWTRWLPGLNYRCLAILRWTLILLGWVLALILASAISERFKE
jgi:hypothetical protein